MRLRSANPTRDIIEIAVWIMECTHRIVFCCNIQSAWKADSLRVFTSVRLPILIYPVLMARDPWLEMGLREWILNARMR